MIKSFEFEKPLQPSQAHTPPNRGQLKLPTVGDAENLANHATAANQANPAGVDEPQAAAHTATAEANAADMNAIAPGLNSTTAAQGPEPQEKTLASLLASLEFEIVPNDTLSNVLTNSNILTKVPPSGPTPNQSPTAEAMPLAAPSPARGDSENLRLKHQALTQATPTGLAPSQPAAVTAAEAGNEPQEGEGSALPPFDCQSEGPLTYFHYYFPEPTWAEATSAETTSAAKNPAVDQKIADQKSAENTVAKAQGPRAHPFSMPSTQAQRMKLGLVSAGVLTTGLVSSLAIYQSWAKKTPAPTQGNQPKPSNTTDRRLINGPKPVPSAPETLPQPNAAKGAVQGSPVNKAPAPGATKSGQQQSEGLAAPTATASTTALQLMKVLSSSPGTPLTSGSTGPHLGASSGGFSSGGFNSGGFSPNALSTPSKARQQSTAPTPTAIATSVKPAGHASANHQQLLTTPAEPPLTAIQSGSLTTQLPPLPSPLSVSPSSPEVVTAPAERLALTPQATTAATPATDAEAAKSSAQRSPSGTPLPPLELEGQGQPLGMQQTSTHPTRSLAQPKAQQPTPTLTAADLPPHPVQPDSLQAVLQEVQSLPSAMSVLMPLPQAAAQEVTHLQKEAIAVAKQQFKVLRLTNLAYQTEWRRSNQDPKQTAPSYGFVDSQRQVIVVPQTQVALQPTPPNASAKLAGGI